MSEKIDLKAYRKESPMDYVKAIKLINKDPKNYIIPHTIYKITRLHIPETIYKYYSFTNDEELNRIKLDTIKNQKVYLAESSLMNDPFEGKAFFYDNTKLSKYKRLQHCDGMLVDDFSKFIKLTSFTAKSVNCMPMWAHYANNHAGFCIAYDTSKNIRLKANLFPVQYTEERIDITGIMDNFIKELHENIEYCKVNNIKEIKVENLILLWISIYYSCIKHKSWSYENEIRCIIGKNTIKDSYMDAKPSAIYIGINCEDLRKKELFDIAYELDIPLYQMYFDYKSYKYELGYFQINR